MASLYEEFLCRSNYVAALVTVYMLVFVVYVIYAVVTHNKPKKEIKEVLSTRPFMDRTPADSPGVRKTKDAFLSTFISRGTSTSPKS